MKRIHVHVSVDDLKTAIRFYSDLLDARPCCGGSTFVNWRLDDPPVNFAASVGHGPRGALHFGLEVEGAADLRPIDRILHGASWSAAAVPWEVSVRKE
jgi:catechol 2,3-dioxygenase-like lactoylglutathione lyase family enzyme